jgi:hypothetical protein
MEVKSQSYLWGLIRKETKSPTASTSSSKKSGVVAQIISEFKDQTRTNIQKWREAMQAAYDTDDPRWFPLQDLFDNLSTDGHLQALMQIRKAAVTGNRFYIMSADGSENEEATQQLQTEWFYNLMEYFLDSIYKKVSVIELFDPANMLWKPVPQRNICPQLQRIYMEVSGNKFINYADPKFQRNLIFTESIHHYGILNDIIPQLIWKRNAQQVWADLAERFGIPMITAETIATNKKQLDDIEDSLNKLGQAANAVLPEGTKVTIHDGSTKGDPHKIFMEQIKTTNDEMSKDMVGGTMVIDDGSSRSQSEVHERTLDKKIAEKDRRMIEFIVNNKLIPMLRMHGFKFNDKERFVFDRSESLSLKEHWEIVSEAATQFEFDQKGIEWIAKTFNVPVVGKKQNTQSNSGTGLTANFR